MILISILCVPTCRSYEVSIIFSQCTEPPQVRLVQVSGYLHCKTDWNKGFTNYSSHWIPNSLLNISYFNFQSYFVKSHLALITLKLWKSIRVKLRCLCSFSCIQIGQNFKISRGVQNVYTCTFFSRKYFYNYIFWYGHYYTFRKRHNMVNSY